MITLRQLRFLTALADELHFSRAAEVCHVTQPTLSTGLRELEDILGVQLAERTKRSVLLTPIGREIAERGRRLLTGAQEIEELAAQHRNPAAGDLRLGAIPTIGPYLLPRTLGAIRAEFPGLRLYLREEMTESLMEGLASGRLDVALIAQPFDIASYESAFLFDDGYHLCTWPGFDTSGAAPLDAKALSGLRMMLLEKGHCLQRHALSAFPDADLQVDDSFSATSLTTLIAMVSEGLGVTLLPDLAVDAGAAAGIDVDLTPLPDACPRHVVLIWRATSPRRPLFLRLAEILTQARKDLRSDAATAERSQ